MRVIAGTARGRKLLSPGGMDTRPTTDRLKETLFNILAPSLQGIAFLDIFSGTGAIGIEALSRGAASAVFIEHQKNAVEIIKENLRLAGLADHALVLHMDYLRGLKKLGDERFFFDIIFLDAPYDRGLTNQALSAVAQYGLLIANGRIIAEVAADEEEPQVRGFQTVRVKKCGTTSFIFMEADR